MIGDRLKWLREKKDVYQKDVADYLGITTSAYGFYEQGQRRIDHETLTKLADYFHVSTDYMLGRTNELIITPSKDMVTHSNYGKLPIVGIIRAGLPILTKENIEGYLDVPEYMRADYILQVKGDSMIGVGILDGDLAICQEAELPQTGQIIVALHDEGSLSEATLKFYMNGNGKPVLRAANPTFADVDYKGGYRTAGVLVALVRKEAPGYQVYKNYIAVPGYDEWINVIEKAAGAGIKPEHLNSHVDMLIQMGKKM